MDYDPGAVYTAPAKEFAFIYEFLAAKFGSDEATLKGTMDLTPPPPQVPLRQPLSLEKSIM